MELTRSTNSITDAVAGVSLTLKKTGTSTITITQSTDVENKLRGFVNAYNAIQDFVAEQYKKDAKDRPVGFGDQDAGAAVAAAGALDEQIDEQIDEHEVSSLRAARAEVLGRIADARARVGRSPADVTLIAVSKTVPAERLRAAVAAGLTLLGENRVQEGGAKRPLVPGAALHLIGPLQSNKVRHAVMTFDAIQTVDLVDLAARIARIAAEEGRAPYPVFVQVNVDRDPAKAGFLPDDAAAALREILLLPGLRLEGLMTIGRFTGTAAEARETFVALRLLGSGCAPRSHASDPGSPWG